MAIWPTTLPQTPLLDGYKSSPQDSVMRSQFEGYTKQRLLYTAVIHNVEESYHFTPQQYETFKYFYNTTLRLGSKEFIKKDPESGVSQNYRFVGPYDPTRVGLDWVVKIKLERLT